MNPIILKVAGAIICFLIPIVGGFVTFAYLSHEIGGASIFPHIRDNITPMIPTIGGIAVGWFLAGIFWRRKSKK